ncbi:penicillin-insensitive murein endopeptidase [Vibrio orientalis CIP 102891 = ATCC 33934]|uniref:Murein endopeptidase n=1 Tax=Vibrio orientalis CIP 102891 = ATCC 33934 TaxID=675816 RepID=C9QL47_VIBOR|nr:penicillin-insensitive murein endopeptidase [Vibrio orientalis]EEX91525.1 murein endopeptidase [Vibrio orientalis CIP 102891 = ATCC 33934]EGU47376.1 penicillin-insensitive murein endopeptidase [Vibrio orientalis CIP 102891 = ATCC 33934]
MQASMDRWYTLPLLCSSLLFASTAAATPWEKINAPSNSAPQAIGSYANGCLSGGAALPLEGEGYQVIRSQRARYYGHPNAIGFIERLAELSHSELKTNILIGDISLPQGGRFSSGHSSHQTGLDIDIWLKLADIPLSAPQLAKPAPHSVVNLKQYQLLKHNWDSRHFELVKFAASDEQVARIFVHPVIKEKLCTTEQSNDREWLRKVRPWWGHHYHMHVRLNCPEGSQNCKPQAMPPKGDGCGAELASWKPQPKPAAPKVASTKPKKKKLKVIPTQCQQLLDNS